MGINTQHAPKKKADKQKDSEEEQEEVEEIEDEEWLGKEMKYRVLKNKVRTLTQNGHDHTTQAMSEHDQRRYKKE